MTATWVDLLATIKVGDSIAYWAAYQSRNKPPFVVLAIEPERVELRIPNRGKPLVVKRPNFDVLRDGYEAYANKKLSRTQYRASGDKFVSSYVISLLRHCEILGVVAIAPELRSEINRILQAMNNRESAAGSLREVTAPLRVVELEFDDLHDLWNTAKGNCALCGQPIPVKTANRLLQMSPDRIDCNKGVYSRDNMQFTHLGCNLGRNMATVPEFNEWLSWIRPSNQS